jgi:predicted protein tyrosine phosphatase
MLKNVLFVCGRNKKRSPTAEELFINHPTITAQSAGLNLQAEVVIDADLIEWADLIIVMSKKQMMSIKSTYKSLIGERKIMSLDIKDKYEHNDPELITLLKRKLHWLLDNM